jgi:hypothetical protein
VLRELLVGPALAGQLGSHVFQSLSGEPEIVRLAVLPGVHEPQAAATAHRDAVAAFDRAIAAGGVAPPNPEPLLPVVRAVNYTAPRRVGGQVEADVEDFVTGFAGRVTDTTLAGVVEQLWHLSWSRVP